MWFCKLISQIMEIALVYDKSAQIDDSGSKSIETAIKHLRSPLIQPNPKLTEKRIRLLEQSYTAIPTRQPPLPPPKLDTRNLFIGRSLSPATSVSTSWTSAIPTSGVTSNPGYADYGFMRTGRLSSASTAESVASFDPGSAWTPTPLTDRFSTSPELESSKNDILEAFLSTIVDDPYPASQLETPVTFTLQGDSPTQPGMVMPTLFDWSNPSFSSDEDADPKVGFGTSPSDVSPSNYVPMFLTSYSPEESTFKPSNDVYGFKDVTGGYGDEGSGHIHTAPNLFSEESGWAV
jgi:hypothetical protein